MDMQALDQVRSDWSAAFHLAKAAQEAGMVVVRITPVRTRYGLEFDISLWTPDGRTWAEARQESAGQIDEHIRRWRESSAVQA